MTAVEHPGCPNQIVAREQFTNEIVAYLCGCPCECVSVRGFLLSSACWHHGDGSATPEEIAAHAALLARA